MCTVLKLNNNEGFFLAKNHDIFFEEGILFTNKRGILKSALIMPPESPLQWISKFGSITFSQCGKELPVGGMNEAGLVVEQTTLPETIYPNKTEGKAVGELQVIQFILDTCASVRQAISALEEIKITQPTWTIHYALFDKDGHMAVVEFIEGEKRLYYGETLPVKVLANSRYDKSLDLYNTETGIRECENEYEQNSLERFIKSAPLTDVSLNYTIEGAFATLDEVRRFDTAWSIVYEPSTLTLYFATQKQSDIKSVSLGNIDFRKESDSLAYKLSNSAKGDITCSLVKYTSELNGELVYNFFENKLIQTVMKASVPHELLNYLKLYPEIMEQQEGKY